MRRLEGVTPLVLRSRLRQWGAICALLVRAGSLHAARSVSLAWDASPSPEVAGYVIYYGNTSRSYPYSTNVGNVTNATIVGLAEGSTWYFTATAITAKQVESDYCNEVSYSEPSSNYPPAISAISDQTLEQDTATAPLPFTVWDRETPAGSLFLIAASSNAVLVPVANVVFGGGGSNRTVTVQPAAGQHGTSRVTVGVSDGQAWSSLSFLVTVNPPRSVSQTYQTWLSQFFSPTELGGAAKEATLWGARANPDGDAWDNLMEFALGLNPRAREASEAGSVSGLIDWGGTRYLVLSFARRKREPQLHYIPEFSGDMRTWQSGGTFAQEIDLIEVDEVFDVVTVQDLTPVAPGSPRFARLRVVSEDP